jgi:predicted MFS family arabinose efflux permease
VWVLAISMVVNRAGSMVLFFTSLYLTKELHYSISQAGFVMSFYGIGSILGSFFGGLAGR